MTVIPPPDAGADAARTLASGLYAEYLSALRPEAAQLPSESEDLFFYDNVSHTCGLDAYPEGASQNPVLESRLALRARFTRDQEAALQRAYRSLSFDFDAPRRLWPEFRGLWLWHVHDDVVKAKPPYGFFGQNKVALEHFAPGGAQAVDDLISSRLFTSVPLIADAGIYFGFGSEIESASLPPDQLESLVAGALFHRFLAEAHACEHFDLTPCDLCGAGFYPQAMGWFAALAPPRYCGTCVSLFDGAGPVKLVSQPKFDKAGAQDRFLAGLRRFFEVFGFVPAATLNRKKLIRQTYETVHDPEAVRDALIALALLPTSLSAKKAFKTWAHFLHAGELLTLTNRGKGGYRSVATDGHLCLSLGERAICEYLTKRRIRHTKEPSYPFDEQLNPNGLLRADYLANGVWIEFAGMLSDTGYAKRMAAKKSLAELKGLPWVQVNPEHLDDLSFVAERIQG